MTLTLQIHESAARRLQGLARENRRSEAEVATSLLESALESKPVDRAKATSGAELMEMWERLGVVGAWANRDDIADNLEFARKLRQQSNTRADIVDTAP